MLDVSIGHGQVDLAVAGEVARDDRIRAARAPGSVEALERAVAVAQEDGDLVEARSRRRPGRCGRRR